MNTSNQKSKYLYLTFISVISAYAVLTLHTNGCFWAFNATERYWKTANIIECVFYFAVPLFYMISSITLMDFYDKYSLKQYFNKRIVKTVIPFIAWSLIGLAWSQNRGGNEHLTIFSVFSGIINAKFVTIYWFFSSLFIIYLCMPLFAAIQKDKRKQVFSYIAIIGFLLNSLIPFIKNVFSIDINIPYAIPMLYGGLFWVPVGWLLHNCELKRWHKMMIYVLSMSGLLMHICGTYYLSIQAGQIIDIYKGYQNVPCVLYSIGIFLLLKEIGTRLENNPTFVRVINFLGQYTFSIYLMQFIFLDLFRDYFATRAILYRLGAPFIIIPIIIVITWCLRKIPIIKHILP